MITLLKICAIGLIAVIVISIIKTYKPELAVAASLCAGIILLYYIIESLGYGFDYITRLYDGLSYGREKCLA